jgi:hypothetical protein
LWIESDPPSFAEFSTVGIVELDMFEGGIVSPVTASILGTNIAVAVDVAVNRSSFAADFGGSVEVVKKAHRRVRESISPLSRPPQVLVEEIEEGEEVEIMAEGREGVEKGPPPLKLRFSLKVLAYNRATSLQRLLASLANADYGQHNDIALEILVDRAKSPSVE